MIKYSSFNEFHDIKSKIECNESFNKLALSILESGKNYNDWWESTGLPVLLEMSYNTTEEYVDKILAEAWNDPTTWFGGNKQPASAPVDPHAEYKQRGQARLEQLKPQIDQIKQMFVKSLEGVKQQLLQQVSRSPNHELLFKLITSIHNNAIKSAQGFMPAMAQNPEAGAQAAKKWSTSFGDHQASAANAGITNAIQNAARYPAQLMNMQPEKISQALQNDKDGTLRQTLMQAIRTAQKSGEGNVAKFIMNAMNLSKTNAAKASAANAQNQSQNQEVQAKQAFIQQVQQKRQERSERSGTIPVALSPEQLDQMWQDHKAKQNGTSANTGTVPFPRKMPPVVPANTGTNSMRREHAEDDEFTESLISQSKRHNDFGIMGL